MSVISIPQNYEEKIDRALHNLYQEKRTTLHPGTLIPIYYRRLFKGDVFDFAIAESLLQSEPTFAPLMANWRLRFEWYFDSDANRYGWIDNNSRLTAEEVMNRRHHTVGLESPYVDSDNVADSTGESLSAVTSVLGIGRGTIWDYAGVAPGYSPVGHAYDESSSVYGRCINADFFLTYLNIVRNYHCNRQFTSVPYIQNLSRSSGSELDYFAEYSADDMDKLFMALRSASNGVHFDLSDVSLNFVNGDSTIPSWMIEPYGSALRAFRDWMRSSQFNSCSGLFCSQYEPDLYQNLLNKDQGLLRSVAQVQNGGVTIEVFRLANHLQSIYDDIYVSGGRDRDLSRTRWGVKSNRQYDIPELICVHSEIIGTNLITANNAGNNGNDYSAVPGDMSGNVNSRRGGSRPQKFTAKTAGSLMCIVSLVPLVDYSQNIERHLLENNFEDEFSPQMARKGFESVPLSDYTVLPSLNYNDMDDWYEISNTPLDTAVGKQVAWLREMTSTNRVHGEFSNYGEKEDWVLKRKFSQVVNSFVSNPNTGDYMFNVETYDFTPYVNPLAFQYPFVSQTIADPNFYLQVGFNVKAYRPIGRRFMPTLGK